MMGVMKAGGDDVPIIDPLPYPGDIYTLNPDQAGQYVVRERADSVEGVLDIQGEVTGQIKVQVTNREEYSLSEH